MPSGILSRVSAVVIPHLHRLVCFVQLGTTAGVAVILLVSIVLVSVAVVEEVAVEVTGV
jgi:hypothetical protein